MRAAILRYEANRIRRAYLELQEVYKLDPEAINAIERMTKELELD